MKRKMIKNWETFLESEDPNIGLMRDILTELEDEFNINVKLSDQNEYTSFYLSVDPYLDKGKSNDILNCVDSLCKRIQDMTGHECMYTLSFRGELKDFKIDWVDIGANSNKVDLLEYRFSYGFIKLLHTNSGMTLVCDRRWSLT
jgi:hypothetical protein